MQRGIFLIALMVSVSLVAQVFAQGRDARCAPNTFCFEDEIVDGDRSAPNVESIVVRSGLRRRSLVEVRYHFVQELVKSVESR